MNIVSRVLIIIGAILFLVACGNTTGDLIIGTWEQDDGSHVNFSDDGIFTFSPISKKDSSGAPMELKGEWGIDENGRLTTIVNDTPIVGNVELVKPDSMVIKWDHDKVPVLYKKKDATL